MLPLPFLRGVFGLDDLNIVDVVRLDPPAAPPVLAVPFATVAAPSPAPVRPTSASEEQRLTLLMEGRQASALAEQQRTALHEGVTVVAASVSAQADALSQLRLEQRRDLETASAQQAATFNAQLHRLAQQQTQQQQLERLTQRQVQQQRQQEQHQQQSQLFMADLLRQVHQLSASRAPSVASPADVPLSVPLPAGATTETRALDLLARREEVRFSSHKVDSECDALEHLRAELRILPIYKWPKGG